MAVRPTIEVGQIVEIRMFGECFGQRIMNVLHYHVSAVAPGSDVYIDAALLALLTECCVANGGNDTLGALMAAALPADFNFQHWEAQVIYPIRYAYVFKGDGFNGSMGDADSPNQTAVITKRSWGTGPHSHGDFFLGPLPTEVKAGGYLTQPYVGTKMEAVGDWLMRQLVAIQAFPGTLYDPVIFRRQLPASSEPVTNFISQRTVRTMRRRTVGLGE